MRALLLLFFPCALFAQLPGVIAVQPPGPGQVTTWIRAIAGYNEDADKTVCTLTVNRKGGMSNAHLVCTVGAQTVQNGDLSVLSFGGVWSFGGGPAGNRVTLALVRGLGTSPDRWEMTANQADFKTGLF